MWFLIRGLSRGVEPLLWPKSVHLHIEKNRHSKHKIPFFLFYKVYQTNLTLKLCFLFWKYEKTQGSKSLKTLAVHLFNLFLSFLEYVCAADVKIALTLTVPGTIWGTINITRHIWIRIRISKISVVARFSCVSKAVVIISTGMRNAIIIVVWISAS